MRAVHSSAAGLLAGLCAFAGAAEANPNGAPWGSADPAGAQNCSSCHFDGEAVRDSKDLWIAGLPAVLTSGETYDLTISLAPNDGVIAGFMLSASAGAFHGARSGIETNEQEARSVTPVPAILGAQWALKWTAPADVSETISFYLVVNAANDDASPFGDQIHFRTFSAKFAD